MQFIENIKRFLRKGKAKRLIGSSKRVLLLKELSDVKTIGVVFDASSEDLYRRSAHLVRHFSAMHKTVRSISIVKSDMLPPYVDSTLSFNYVLNKEISWVGIPKNKYVDNFVKQEFDLLINLDFKGNSSLNFIVNTSLAHLKVGMNTGNSEVELDFMLEGIKENDLSIFMRELLKYLELIKTK